MSISSPHLTAFSSEVAALAASAGPSVVSIAHKRAMASGFFWRPDIVVTASEAIAAPAGEAVEVLADGGNRMTGTIVAHDPGTDVALVRVAGTGAAVATSATPLALGQAVVVAGRTPHGATASVGFVMLAGGSWHSMRGGDLSQRVWLDARMPRTAEGGAVLSVSGAFAGMAVFGPRRRVVMIPADTIERVGSELLTHGRIRHGYLGVSVQAVSLAGGTSGNAGGTGLMVMGLDDKGPGAAAGILRGDILTAIDGTPPKSPRSLARLLPGSTIGAQKRVDLVRAGQSTQVTVTIGDRPTS